MTSGGMVLIDSEGSVSGKVYREVLKKLNEVRQKHEKAEARVKLLETRSGLLQTQRKMCLLREQA